MTTVIVTGAGGFVGSHVVQKILEKTTWRVIVIDSFRHNGQTPNLVEVATPYLDRVEAWVHDLRAPFSYEQKEDARFAKMVINVASRCSVAQSIVEPEPFILNNVQSTLTMLELAKWVRPQQFVHISTDEVFGPGEPEDYSIHMPSSPYSASKAAQEDFIRAYANTYEFPATVLTCSNMFGERQSGLAYIPRVVKACLLQRPLDVHATNGSYGSRTYLYAGNMADKLVDALQGSALKGFPSGFNRSLAYGQRVVDNREMVELIAGVTNTDVPPLTEIDISAVRPGYDLHYSQETNTNYPLSFEDALRQTVDWYREKLKL